MEVMEHWSRMHCSVDSCGLSPSHISYLVVHQIIANDEGLTLVSQFLYLLAAPTGNPNVPSLVTVTKSESAVQVVFFQSIVLSFDIRTFDTELISLIPPTEEQPFAY